MTPPHHYRNVTDLTRQRAEGNDGLSDTVADGIDDVDIPQGSSSSSSAGSPASSSSSSSSSNSSAPSSSSSPNGITNLSINNNEASPASYDDGPGFLSDGGNVNLQATLGVVDGSDAMISQVNTNYPGLLVSAVSLTASIIQITWSRSIATTNGFDMDNAYWTIGSDSSSSSSAGSASSSSSGGASSSSSSGGGFSSSSSSS